MTKRKRHGDRFSRPANDVVDYADVATSEVNLNELDHEAVMRSASGAVVNLDAARRRPSVVPGYDPLEHVTPVPTRQTRDDAAYAGPDHFAHNVGDVGDMTAPMDTGELKRQAAAFREAQQQGRVNPYLQRLRSPTYAPASTPTPTPLPYAPSLDEEEEATSFERPPRHMVEAAHEQRTRQTPAIGYNQDHQQGHHQHSPTTPQPRHEPRTVQTPAVANQYQQQQQQQHQYQSQAQPRVAQSRLSMPPGQHPSFAPGGQLARPSIPLQPEPPHQHQQQQQQQHHHHQHQPAPPPRPVAQPVAAGRPPHLRASMPPGRPDHSMPPGRPPHPAHQHRAPAPASRSYGPEEDEDEEDIEEEYGYTGSHVFEADAYEMDAIKRSPVFMILALVVGGALLLGALTLAVLMVFV